MWTCGGRYAGDVDRGYERDAERESREAGLRRSRAAEGDTAQRGESKRREPRGAEEDGANTPHGSVTAVPMSFIVICVD